MNEAEASQLRRKRATRAIAPGPDKRIIRRSFVATIVAPPEGSDIDVAAHIKRAVDMPTVIASRGVSLHESVLDIVADLLVEIAREDCFVHAPAD